MLAADAHRIILAILSNRAEQGPKHAMPYNLNKFRHCAEQLVATGQRLHQRGWTPATSSNFSMRLDQDFCAVTVSGRHKGLLNPDDIMVVDLQGQAMEDKRPSAEVLLHTQLYQWDKRINAVLHTHSRDVTVYTMLHGTASELQLRGYELQKAFSGITSHEDTVIIPIFDNTQDIAALAGLVERRLAEYPDCPAYLIRGHGAYTWGDSMASCERHLEALEFLISCELQRHNSLSAPPVQ